MQSFSKIFSGNFQSSTSCPPPGTLPSRDNYIPLERRKRERGIFTAEFFSVNENLNIKRRSFW